MSREQKIEIVSTLQSYPYVLKELDLHYQLWMTCESIKDIYYEQVKKSDAQILILQEVKANDDTQIDLLKQQLKTKKRSGWVVPLLIGVGSGVVIGVL